MITSRLPRVAPRHGKTGPGDPARLAGSVAWAAGTVVVGVVLFACYLRQSRTTLVGSDGASQALQAWAMLHGNLLLHGWWVTDVSFYTTELPQYALIEFARGLSADVIHVAGAMTYTLLVLAAAFLARGRARGAAGLARALVAGGIMVAPSLGPGTQTLVLSPDHTGTAIPVLLTWLLIERAKARWYVPVLVWLALSWAALADAMVIFVGIIPLALACALRAGRNPAALARAYRYEGALFAAAVLAVPTELAATRLIRSLGGWQVHGLATRLAAPGQLAGNARLTGRGLLELFGADVFGAAGSPLAVTFAVVHLAGFALAAAGVAAAARSLLRELFRRNPPRREPHQPQGGDSWAGRADLIPAVLLIAIIIDVAAYLAGVQAVNIASTREIAPVLPFAAVLAGRLIGDRLASSAASPGARGPAGRPALIARSALCAVLAAYAAMLGYAAAQPSVAPRYAALAGWLRAHHLADGLSGYTQANIVTLESGGAVNLRAVRLAGHGYLTGYTWNASATWFNPAKHSASYLVITVPGAPSIAGSSGITAAEAVKNFGHPARTLHYKWFAILIWPRQENLLARLRKPIGGG